MSDLKELSAEELQKLMNYYDHSYDETWDHDFMYLAEQVKREIKRRNL